MDFLSEVCEEIEFDSPLAVIQLFTKLYEEISVFNEKLKAYSRQEEEGLFLMMARHLENFCWVTTKFSSKRARYILSMKLTPFC